MTACLAGLRFFRMLLPEAYLTDDFVYPERTGAWDQFKQPFNQLVRDIKVNGGHRLMSAIGVRMVTITANVALYKAIFQWIQPPSN